MMHYNLYTFSLLCLSLISSSSAFSPNLLGNPNAKSSSALFFQSEDALDKAKTAEPLPFTAEDLKLLQSLRTRVVTIPIVLMDAILPKQELSFISSDENAEKMLKYALECDTPEIGVIGFNPHDGSPLNKGVTAPIAKDQLAFGVEDGSDMSIGIKLKGDRCFDVVGEPFMGKTNSFYLANVEITDNRKETMTEEMTENAQLFFSLIPDLVGDFLYWMKEEEVMTKEELDEHVEALGPLPEDDWKERALWVGALVNPVPALMDVCPDIRPALLSCRNSHDRLAVASIALRSAIERLSSSNAER